MGTTSRLTQRLLRSTLARSLLAVTLFTMLIGVGVVVIPFHGSRTPVAHAANGDLVHTTNFSTPCPAPVRYFNQQVGVGIAFDGTYLWYSCAATGANPDLYKASPLFGTVVASYNVAGGLGALAWDGVRKQIWAGWGAGAGADGDVRLIDPTTGVGTVVFNATAANISGIHLDDGLTFDAQDNSLYISDDTSTTIYHYTPAGAVLGSFPWGGSGCFNSGLAIGGGLLFQGSDGCNHVWVVNKTSLAAAFNFNTGAGGVRDEDLECDDVTFTPKTVMWSMEAYEPRRATAFEIPAGSCGTGGGVDSDGDGLLNEWETHGVWIQPNGVGAPVFIDLPAMGADPNKPDIFLHVDWMQDATHNQSLQTAAIQKIVTAFANSPYVSPTGSVGINLHVDEGANSVNFPTTLSRAQSIPWASSLGTFSGSSYDWTAFQAIKDANFTPTGRSPIFHYVIAASSYGSPTNSSSGISRGIGASDYIVSLGLWPGGTGTVNQQAGTLMHELGHNLGLQHGGGDGTNFKPNYLSIMSYAFQVSGLTIGGVGGNFDYSRSALGTLNEASLNEPAGVPGAPAGYGTVHWCPGIGYVPVNNASGPIDWDCDGNTTGIGVSADINGDGAITTLTGYNDWANLKLKGGAIGLAGVAPTLPMLTEPDLFTLDVAKQVLTAIPVPVDIRPQTCPNPWNPGANGVLPVAVLGTTTFPATLIDPATVMLDGVPALRSSLEDVATPFAPFTGKQRATDCTTAGPDGLTDLNVTFDNQALAAAVGPVTKGQVLVLPLAGKLKDGTPIAGEDVVVIVKASTPF